MNIITTTAYSEQSDQTLPQLAQILKSIFPSVPIDVVNGAIHNYVTFKRCEQDILIKDASYRGAYLLVNGPESIYICETQDSAFQSRENIHAFIGCIGIEDSSQEILAVSRVEKPDLFDDFNAR